MQHYDEEYKVVINQPYKRFMFLSWWLKLSINLPLELKIAAKPTRTRVPNDVIEPALKALITHFY